MLKRFNISSRTKRIGLSVIALVVALLIAFLQEDPNAAPGGSVAAVELAERPGGGDTQVARADSREKAVAQAIRWLKAQEGGKHRGHAIARHVGKSDQQLRDRLERDDRNVASGFYDLETAAVAIVRTIRHKPNDDRVRRWLGDDESRRRLALRRAFEKPIGRIAYRDGRLRDGNTAVAVLTKWRQDGRTTYRLLTAYVEP